MVVMALAFIILGRKKRFLGLSYIYFYDRMLFNSWQFLIFFPTVVGLYFILPHRFRWGWLLLVSCYFYMCFIPVYILVLAFTITIDYFAAIFIERLTGTRKRYFLILSIISNVGILFVFKYYNFFNVNLSALAQLLHWNYSLSSLSIILPIGLSFHTFQSLSYIIEVYRGKQVAERNYGIFALYVMFFPQLVAGPIERAKNILPQFYEKHYFEYNRVLDGLKLMMWGFFKKLVIADKVALVVDMVYKSPQNFSGLPLIIATVLFAFQIYCDFSGYSDIAIGSAQVLGFNLMDNFRRPYFSKSISEFWKRWHISLSSWFRDYVYISLGGNRVNRLRLYLNIFVTFIISGLWHGAAWTFVAWGAFHGFLLALDNLIRPLRNNIDEMMTSLRIKWLGSVIQILSTFILVNIGWVFFRSNNIDDAVYILTNLLKNISFSFTYFWQSILVIFNSKAQFATIVFSIIFMEIIHLMQEHDKMRHFMNNKPVYLRWSVYVLAIIMILVFGEFNEQYFIYFQF